MVRVQKYQQNASALTDTHLLVKTDQKREIGIPTIFVPRARVQRGS
jgi:hypothetical protein